jgi:hypothetical protein
MLNPQFTYRVIKNEVSKDLRSSLERDIEKYVA